LIVKAKLNLLPPECHGLLTVRHSGLDGATGNRAQTAEIVATTNQPRIDDIGLSHIFHPHRAVRFPSLLKRGPHALWRAAILAIHCSALLDAIVLPPSDNVLNVPPRRIGRLPVELPGR